MQSKQMVAIAVVAILAASAVGIAYAATASTTNTDNVVGTDIITMLLTNGDDDATPSYSQDFVKTIEWDTNSQANSEGTGHLVTYTLKDGYEPITGLNKDGDTDTNDVLIKLGEVYMVLDVSQMLEDTFSLEATPSATATGTYYYSLQIGDTPTEASAIELAAADYKEMQIQEGVQVTLDDAISKGTTGQVVVLFSLYASVITPEQVDMASETFTGLTSFEGSFVFNAEAN